MSICFLGVSAKKYVKVEMTDLEAGGSSNVHYDNKYSRGNVILFFFHATVKREI